MKYVYPAIFENSVDGGYVVSFPDLQGCYSQGDTQSEALYMARDALSQWLEYCLEKKEPLPEPTEIGGIVLEVEGFANLVDADVKDGRAVKRTVSIPRWMDEQSSEMGLSLSRVLQESLAKKFQ